MTFGVAENIAQSNDVQKTQQPKGVRAGNMIHDAVHHVLEVLDTLLNGVLVLVVWFALAILDCIHPENIFHHKTSFRLSIVGLEAFHGTIFSDEIQEGGRKSGFRGNRVSRE